MDTQPDRLQIVGLFTFIALAMLAAGLGSLALWVVVLLIGLATVLRGRGRRS